MGRASRHKRERRQAVESVEFPDVDLEELRRAESKLQELCAALTSYEDYQWLTMRWMAGEFEDDIGLDTLLGVVFAKKDHPDRLHLTEKQGTEWFAAREFTRQLLPGATAETLYQSLLRTEKKLDAMEDKDYEEATRFFAQLKSLFDRSWKPA